MSYAERRSLTKSGVSRVLIREKKNQRSKIWRLFRSRRAHSRSTTRTSGQIIAPGTKLSLSLCRPELRSTIWVDRSNVDLTMKLKTLKKKIRKLEARLKEGPEKLAKLKRKLEAMTKANAMKDRKKLAARAAKARETAKSLTPVQKKAGG